MKIRLGYACISETINVTSSHSYTYTLFQKEKDFEKLDNIIIDNLKSLEELFLYNIKNNIHFFRMSSNIIPLATKKEVEFDYINKFKKYYDRLSSLIDKYDLRVDFHPGEFCVLNSVKESVISDSIQILKYHYRLLDALNIKNKILVLHVGSNAFGKENSIRRFINTFNKLPEYLKKCIAIENDDKIFTVSDCLTISKEINIPVVLDYHHNFCNPSNFSYIDILNTWKITPKFHFSSPKSKLKKEYRHHHDYIDVFTFINFLEEIKHLNRDIDIMIEAKKKDEALFRLVRALKYYTDYKFIDETTFII